MAFDAETLKTLGVDESLVDKIIKAHNDDISGSYIPKTRFDEVNGELKETKKSLTERDAQIETLKGFEGDNTALKAKVEELQGINKAASEKYTAEVTALRKKTALRDLLSDAQDADLVMSQLDMNTITVAEDGSITGAKEQVDALRQSKSFLFKEPSSNSGDRDIRGGGKPPEGGQMGATRVSQEDYGKRLAETRNAAIKSVKSAEAYYFGGTK